MLCATRGAGGFSQLLAVRIGTFQPTQIGTVAHADRGHEEAHQRIIGRRRKSNLLSFFVDRSSIRGLSSR